MLPMASSDGHTNLQGSSLAPIEFTIFRSDGNLIPVTWTPATAARLLQVCTLRLLAMCLPALRLFN